VKFGWVRRACAAVLLFVCSGCEEHELTRPVDGDTSYRWALVWVATTLLVGVVTYLVVQRIQTRGGWRRTIGGGAWILAIVFVVIVPIGAGAAQAWRGAQIQRDHGGCVEIPYDERPPSLMQLTCEEDGVNVDFGPLGLFFVAVAGVIYAGTLAIPVVMGLVALRSRAQYLWIPATLAALAMLGPLQMLLNDRGCQRALGVLGALVAVTSSTCLFAESAQRDRLVTT
jgi:hypothetical protein